MRKAPRRRTANRLESVAFVFDAHDDGGDESLVPELKDSCRHPYFECFPDDLSIETKMEKYFH